MDLGWVVDFLKLIGINSAQGIAGWLVAVAIGGFAYWRMKQQDEAIDKITQILEKQGIEWRDMVKRTDDITFDMLENSTKTMSILTEKINTLQLLLLQLSGKK